MTDPNKDTTNQPKDKWATPKTDAPGQSMNKPEGAFGTHKTDAPGQSMNKPEGTFGTPKMDAPKHTGDTAKSAPGARTVYAPEETVAKVGQAMGSRTSDSSMDLLTSKWQELKGLAREKWDKLTDADFDRVSGKPAELSAILQQRYSYAANRAETEIADFLRANTKE